MFSTALVDAPASGARFLEQASAGLAMSAGPKVDFDLSFVAQMVVFASLVFLLKPLLFDPVLLVFAERDRRTDGAKADARTMQREAGELLRQYEHELDRVRRVAGEERDRIRAETAKLEAEILEEARSAANKIVADGRQRIAEEAHEIRFDLGRQSERLAREVARSVLGREVS